MFLKECKKHGRDTMSKIFSLILGVTFPLMAQWLMFSDSKDTYIYNVQTGEIYIRYKKGGKNYEDVFVKMQQGIHPKALGEKSEDSLQDAKMQSLKKSQEMMNEALKESF